jgi:hypothetical protein
MADTKISALPSATTPLAGTEIVPLVQSSTTKNVSVANLTAGRDISCAGLTTTGNTILGDATTDNVRINGYLGVGGAGDAGEGIRISSTALTGTTQTGLRVSVTGTSSATSTIREITTIPITAAASFTVSNLYGYYAQDAIKGAGSTITSQYGIYIADQTQGTNNYGLRSVVSSGANKWNLYASGTADNYMAGNLQFASGKGIDFSATSHAAGMTSELLNDYEEGTWTGTLTGGTTAPTTPITATGFYTKIGNSVLATIIFANVDTTGASGQIIVTGLPFAGKVGVNQIGSAVSYGLSIPNKTYNSYLSGGSSSFEFVSSADNGAWSFTNITAGASKYLNVSMTYIV